MLEVSFEPDIKERVRLQRAAVKHLCDAAARSRVNAAWSSLVIAILLLAAFNDVLVRLMARSLGRSRAEDIWAIGFPALCLLAIVFVWFRVVPAIVLQSIRRLSPPIAYKVAADDQGLRWESENSRYAVDWPAVNKVFTTTEAICFLVGDTLWYVPKRAFDGPNGVDTFLSFVLPRVTSDAKGGAA